jgi:uncharacterized protein
MQGYTGSVDEINESVYHYLKENDAYHENISSSTIDKLIKRGYLTEQSIDEERKYIIKIAEIYHRRAAQQPHFLFAPTFFCQMRCIYCYEAHMTHRENETSLKVMTSKHVKGAYAALDQIVEGVTKKFIDDKSSKFIGLFGGEPLIAKNYKIVCEIVEEGIKRKYKFQATTNGYELFKYKDLLGPGKIENLQITLDGPEQVHNKRRFTKNGLPTFNNIVENIQLALDMGCQISIRTNVDTSNITSLKELNRFYIDKGWNKYPNFSPYAFIVKDHPGKTILPMELLTYLNYSYSDDVSDNIINVDFGISKHFNAFFKDGKTPVLKPYYCGSNFGSYIFGPDEYIYTCWDEVGLEEGRVGKYLPELSWNYERLNEWQERNITKIPKCLDCSYAFICGGGCTHQAKRAYGSVLSPYCFQFPETFQYLVPILYDQRIKKLRESKQNTDENNVENMFD